MSQPTFPEPKTCAFCPTEFVPVKAHQKYCSEKCRKNAYWATHEVVGVEEAAALDWALAKLAKHQTVGHYKLLESLRSKIKT